MEMERINEDTIKVLIMPEDLEERGINFLELISNHARIEQFFYSILEAKKSNENKNEKQEKSGRGV